MNSTVGGPAPTIAGAPQIIAAPKLATEDDIIHGNELITRLRKALRLSTALSSDYDTDHIVRPDGYSLRKAGVLAAFHANDGRLYLTKRAATMNHHPGQIALPGGKQEPDDNSVVAAAIREANEEITLEPSQLELIGTLPPHLTVTQFHVTPVVAVIHGPFTPRAETGEVAEVFTLPFTHIANPDNYRLEQRIWHGELRTYYVAPFGPYYLWGATARILLGLAQRLAV